MYFMVLISQANCRNKSSDPGAHDQYFQLGVLRRAICHGRCLWRKIAFDHIVSVGTNELSNCLEEWAMEMNISLVLLFTHAILTTARSTFYLASSTDPSGASEISDTGGPDVS
jgi:hypothetical protein